ncbi:MAG: ATPase domain-containing protein [Bacillota bacterium]
MKNVERKSTGLKGLDEILRGGLIPNRFYLVRGGPGTGKTTFGLHFLLDGIARGEKALFITFTEPAEKIKQNAARYGFDLDKIDFLDLNPDSNFFEENQDYDLLSSDQMEQKPLLDKIAASIEEIKPDRIFFDGITQLKYVASDQFKFRKQLLSLMQFTMKYNSTILLTSEASSSNPDDDLQFLVDGVINLDLVNNYSLHTINVSKMRGTSISKGIHSFKFTPGGLEVYPNLKLETRQMSFSLEQISSGVAEIDKMLSGGLEKGTSTIISGPTGVGKTTLGLQFLSTSALQGAIPILYTFEEGRRSLLERAEKIQIPIKSLVEQEKIIVKEINPLKYNTKEFFQQVRQDVEENAVDILMLDSISAFFLLFEKNDFSEQSRQVYNLLEYLKGLHITVFLTNEVANITGNFQVTDHKISYLSDNIIFLRHLEIKGKLKKSIGVLKKRMSDFENDLREFEITGEGIKVGQPLDKLRGLLTGSPEFIE